MRPALCRPVLLCLPFVLAACGGSEGSGLINPPGTTPSPTPSTTPAPSTTPSPSTTPAPSTTPSPTPGGTRQTLTLSPAADATLYESSAGTLANGAGQFLFVGRTQQAAENLRRSVLRFALAGQLPTNATITSATLEFTLSRARGGALDLRVHRMQRPWNEGPASPGGAEGQGAPAAANDVTWRQNGLDAFWDAGGGDFDQAPSVNTSVTAAAGRITIDDPDGLLRDNLQFWLANPAENHGWILLADSGPSGTTRRLNSREHSDEASRPQLIIEYREP